MGAAAGSALCCCTVLKTTLAYHNHGMIEDFYGINLRHLLRMAEQYYGNEDLTIWMPHTDATRDRKSTRLNSSHIQKSRMPSSA